MTSANSLITHGCIMSRLIDLCTASSLKCVLTWPSSTKLHCPCFSLSVTSHALDSWRPVLLVKTGKEGIQYIVSFHLLYNQISRLLQEWVHIFPSILFVIHALREALLVIFVITCQIQFYVGIGFLNPISASLDSVSYSFWVTHLCFYLLCALFLCLSLARSSLFVPCRSPSIFA